MSVGALGSGRALICGSLAFDTIMVFGDRFANHILPDKIHILNVSFLVPQMRREYGGCAGNIAYNLSLLGDHGVPMATVGSDFGPYRERLERGGIPTGHVRVIASELTAQAFITTDLDDNQITAFHPGAMQHSHANRVSEAHGITLGIVAPDGREGMLEHAAQFAAAGIPFIFDPGQGLPMFGAEELQRFLRQARWVTVNDYEWQLLQQKSRWGVSEIMQHVEALIVTRGAAGAVIHTRGEEIGIPAAPVHAV
ncbi:MAG TPA: carbohydrate kinase family protein, partial [Steroidobacteraceae bacterium]|nr:carbohydrate kinase family protein [Steroidobacteraceae bacterium]